MKIIDGGGKPASETIEYMREVVQYVEEHVAYQRVRARTLKAFYDGLIAEGFSEDQAMEIIKDDQ